MKKSEVETRGQSWHSAGLPTVNVKYGNGPYDAARKLEEQGIDEEIAGKAVDFAVESAQERFWNEDAPEIAQRRLGGVEVYSDGRMGGWLIVKGLSPVESWDAVDLAKWRGFCRRIREVVDWLTSAEILLEDIESNRWAEPYAERFNFYEGAGGTLCVADIERAAAEAADAARRAVIEGS